MIIDVSADFLVVSFVKEDFKHPAGGAEKIIDGIKKQIGHCSKNPNGFDYDEDNKRWFIADTQENRSILTALKEEFLRDKNQLSIL